MRKHQKQEIQNFINTLYEAHNEIKKFVEAELFEQAMLLLAQCQEVAVQIGSVIEEAEGEDVIAIGLLEDYCEQLYQIHERLSEGQVPSAGKIYKMLRRQLIRIENSVRNDIPVQLEAVFLPYKASMWDSLESIWQAAEEDETCDAYVLPIPYYDRNPDGSFGEMHYEGELFPDYVPITHYSEYNLEEHRPDMIYIHNPYDGQNLVTSVHPAFYSDKLKQYTDCLVYIPYFVLGEFSLEDRETVKANMHFITLPAVFHADYIVVQSKNMRQVYVDVLTEQTGKEIESYWKQKIWGLGSPKFDQISLMQKDDLEIPQEWVKLIKKPDGSRKKIVLYNTSVGALLEHGEKGLEKIQEVFQIFKKYEVNIVLLWRPHPLFKATLKSMKPQLLDTYEHLVKQYREEAWGIYDDTASLDRAIALCDAYYGDPSSLIQLCQKAEKPIMIQNMKSMDKHCRRLRFLDFYDEGDYIWFCALYTGDIFRYNRKTGNTQLIDILPIGTLHETYRAIHIKDGKLYLAPVFEDNIAIIDLVNESIKRFKLPDNTEQYRRMPSQLSPNFGKIYSYGKYLFFVPFSFGAIVRLDTETNHMEYFCDFVDMLLPSVHNAKAFWFADSCVVGSKIYMPSSCANALVEFDMDSCTTVLYKPIEEEISYSGISYDGRYFWLLNHEGDTALAWNNQEGVVDKVDLEYKGKYNYIFSLGDTTVRIPCCGDLTYEEFNRSAPESLSKRKMQIEESEEWSLSHVFKDNDAALCVKLQGDQFFVYTTKRDSLCVLDKMGVLQEEHILEVGNHDYKQFAQSQSKRFHTIMEKQNRRDFLLVEDSADATLMNFLQYISESPWENRDSRQSIETSGKIIFKDIKKEVLYG